MYICENCGLTREEKWEWKSLRFCSSKCQYSFSTKAKRKEINEKVSLKLSKGIGSRGGKPDKEFICKHCNKIYNVNKKDSKFCSRRCSVLGMTDITKEKLSIAGKKRCQNIEERQRLKEIGRKGGFGNKGYINGIYYHSNLEKQCFEYLLQLNIKFEAHKSLPESSKDSDIYLLDSNIWIELDGINREKKKKWLGNDYLYWQDKIKQYSDKKLNLKIFYSFDEFKEFLQTMAI